MSNNRWLGWREEEILTCAFFLAVIGGLWYIGADDKSVYSELGFIDIIGMAIGDTIRGIGVAYDWVRSTLAGWLGFE